MQVPFKDHLHLFLLISMLFTDLWFLLFNDKRVGVWGESLLFRITFTKMELKMIPFLLLTLLASKQPVSPLRKEKKKDKRQNLLLLDYWPNFNLHNY